MLMDDGTDPSEIGPGGQFVSVKIAGHQPDAAGKLVFGQPARAWAIASGKSKIVAIAAGRARRKAKVHVPEAPPTSSTWRKSSSPSWATRPSAMGAETECMAAMKAARSASAPRMLAAAGPDGPT